MDVLSASEADNTIAWYENDGNQAFSRRVITSDAQGAYWVDSVDVDSDGDLDVLSASAWDDTIAWHENDGNQSFTSHTVTEAADGASSVSAADFDGDGDVDILSGSFFDDTIRWHDNDGLQNFTTRVVTTSADGVYAVLAVDADSDGDTDIVSASFETDTVAWYSNETIHGTALFPTSTDISTTSGAASDVWTGDLDRDGDIDIVSASAADNTLAWFVNNGQQVFTSQTITTTAAGLEAVFATETGDLG